MKTPQEYIEEFVPKLATFSRYEVMHLLTEYGEAVLEEERAKRLLYMDFVDEMAVDTPFDIAFKSLNDRLEALTPPKE